MLKQRDHILVLNRLRPTQNNISLADIFLELLDGRDFVGGDASEHEDEKFALRVGRLVSVVGADRLEKVLQVLV